MRRAVLAICAVLAGAVASPAQAKPLYGIQGLAGPTRAGSVPDYEAARQLGARVARVESSWAALEPTGPGRAPDPAALASLDNTIQAAASRGIKVVLFVNRTPCWASSAPDALRDGCRGADANRQAVWRYSPIDPVDAVPIHTFLAARYGAKLAAIEVWNEPDQVNEEYWAGPDKVSKYVALVKALYRPLKRVSPQLPVLAGSFVGTDSRWLIAMYEQGVKGHYDGLAVHFYDLPLQALVQTRATQRRFDDVKPMWLTEFGFSSCYRVGGPRFEFGHPCVTRAVQAQNLADALVGISRVPYVKVAIQFNLLDQIGGFKFGLLDINRRVKPAYRVVSKLLRGGRISTTRPTVRLARQGSRLVATGEGSAADVLHISVFRGSTLRLKALVRTDPRRRWGFQLPYALGTCCVRVVVRHGRLPGVAEARI